MAGKALDLFRTADSGTRAKVHALLQERTAGGWHNWPRTERQEWVERVSSADLPPTWNAFQAAWFDLPMDHPLPLPAPNSKDRGPVRFITHPLQ